MNQSNIQTSTDMSVTVVVVVVVVVIIIIFYLQQIARWTNLITEVLLGI
jgi:hypothetical protein